MISESRKVNALSMIALFLAGTAIAFGPAMMASRRIGAFCRDLPSGAARADVVSRAAGAGMDVSDAGAAKVLVEHPSSMGRAYCVVHFDDDGGVARVVVGE